MKIIKNRNQLKVSIRIYERYNTMINLLTFIVFFAVIYYLYFINKYLDNYKHKQFIITFYQNSNLRLSLIAILFVFMTGYFGKRFILLSIIITFCYVISMIQLQQKYNIFTKTENMSNLPKLQPKNKPSKPKVNPVPHSTNTLAPENMDEHFTNKTTIEPSGVQAQTGIAYNFDMS